MELRKKNHFDLLRFAAASAVLLSHTFPITTGSNLTEPLYAWSGHELTLGKVAVVLFFILSGFLIAGSWESKKSFSPFLYARLLRIWPGLAVMLVLTIGAAYCLTTDPAAFSFSAMKYFVNNMSLYNWQVGLAGVFENNHFSGVVNGALWTLRLEFTAYMVVAMLGMMRLLERRTCWVVWLLACLWSSLGPAHLSFMHEFSPLLAWFMGGTLAFLYRDQHFSRGWLAGLAVVAVIAACFDLSFVWLAPALACALIRLAYCDGPLTRFGKYGDFSYGMYIYAFPVQQYFASRYTAYAWWENFLLAFPVTLLLSVMSWHLVEKRFLRLKGRSLARMFSLGAIDGK